MPVKRNHLHLRGARSASAILAVLGVVAVTSMVVGVALLEARNRFRAAHQSSRWVQAEHAAEAGAEVAMLTAQKQSWSTEGWTVLPDNSAMTKTITLSTGGPTEGPARATVYVNLVTMGEAQWLRIRSTGEADLSGGAVAGGDKQDVMLRKLSLQKDRLTGASVGTAPRATRTVEILAAPKPLYPYKYTFASRRKVDFRANATVDSYDSSDPAKSDFAAFGTHGVYTPTKRQQDGDVGTTDTPQWNFNSGQVWGDVHTPSGSVAQTSNVHGQVKSAFAFETPAEVSPTWTIVTQNHGIVTDVSKTIFAGSQSNPTRHKFTSIALTKEGNLIRVQKPAGQTESWVEIWVTGDTYVEGKNGNGIKLDPGVHATIHFGGSVLIDANSNGYGLANDSKRSENLIVRAYGGSSGTIKDFTINGDFWGAVSAPWYHVKFEGWGRQVHGSFVSWLFSTGDGVNLHYDEALAKLVHGTGQGWIVRSFVEAVR
jgi:hypothetical protein